MARNRCYLSGPMTGVENLNFPAFHKAAAELRARGLAVVNPAELDEADSAPLEWAECLRRDIRQMMDCDTIALLPGWDNSRGAQLEYHVASQLGFAVIDLTGAA